MSSGICWVFPSFALGYITQYCTVGIMLESEENVNSVCQVFVSHWPMVKIMRKSELRAGFQGPWIQSKQEEGAGHRQQKYFPNMDWWLRLIRACRIQYKCNYCPQLVLCGTLAHWWWRVGRWFSSLAMARYTDLPTVNTWTEIFIKDYGEDSLKSDF